MKPVVKKKRIDPRYFLNETVDRERLEEFDPLTWIDEKESLSHAQKSLDTDEDGDIDAKDLATLRSKKGRKEHENGNNKNNNRDRDPRTPGKQVLLKGEKALYEKIRNAIEEVFNEYLEER